MSETVSDRGGPDGPGAGPSSLDTMRGYASRFSLRNYTLIAVLIVTWVVFAWLTDGIFLTQRNLTLMALQSAITGFAAISAVMLIVTRNFDISVGSAVALVGVVVAWLTVKLGVDPLLAMGVALVVGMALGSWNGWWVTRVGVPSFIVTLASMLIFRGISIDLDERRDRVAGPAADEGARARLPAGAAVDPARRRGARHLCGVRLS